MQSLTIGGLAATADVSVETIRYYQRRGLLRKPSRDAGVRRYQDDDVRRLSFIRSAQTAGFTLEEIGELLDLDAVKDRTRARNLAILRIDALDMKIAELQAARTALARLASDCGRDLAGPCPILSAFDNP